MGEGPSFSCSAWQRLALKGLSSSSVLPVIFKWEDSEAGAVSMGTGQFGLIWKLPLPGYKTLPGEARLTLGHPAGYLPLLPQFNQTWCH